VDCGTGRRLVLRVGRFVFLTEERPAKAGAVGLALGVRWWLRRRTRPVNG